MLFVAEVVKRKVCSVKTLFSYSYFSQFRYEHASKNLTVASFALWKYCNMQCRDGVNYRPNPYTIFSASVPHYNGINKSSNPL